MWTIKAQFHLIYFKGDPVQGDVYYVRSKDWGVTFSAPIRVNSEQGTAVAAGTIRGACIALGENGRVHVAWNGSSKSSIRGPLIPGVPSNSRYNGLPMLYTRLNDTGMAFEEERNLMKLTFGLDGGARSLPMAPVMSTSRGMGATQETPKVRMGVAFGLPARVMEGRIFWPKPRRTKSRLEFVAAAV